MNEISHSYKMDLSISVLGIVKWHFFKNLIERSVSTQLGPWSHSVASDQGLHYLSLSHKKHARL